MAYCEIRSVHTTSGGVPLVERAINGARGETCPAYPLAGAGLTFLATA